MKTCLPQVGLYKASSYIMSYTDTYITYISPMMPKRLPTFRISPANGPNAKAQAAAEWCSAGLQRMALQLERRGRESNDPSMEIGGYPLVN